MEGVKCCFIHDIDVKHSELIAWAKAPNGEFHNLIYLSKTLKKTLNLRELVVQKGLITLRCFKKNKNPPLYYLTG